VRELARLLRGKGAEARGRARGLRALRQRHLSYWMVGSVARSRAVVVDGVVSRRWGEC
jgi:hypothetical protein